MMNANLVRAAAPKAQEKNRTKQTNLTDIMACAGDGDALRRWRRACGSQLSNKPLALRVVPELEGLMVKWGYATVKAETLAREMNISRRSVLQAFKMLTDARAIVRQGNRIYPLRTVLETPVRRKPQPPAPQSSLPSLGTIKVPSVGTADVPSLGTKGCRASAPIPNTQSNTQDTQPDSERPPDSMRQAAPPDSVDDGKEESEHHSDKAPQATIALSDHERKFVAEVYGLSPAEIDLVDTTPLNMDIADAIKRLGGQGSEAFKAWRAYADRRHHAPPWWSADEFGPRAVEAAFWESPFWKSWQADRGQAAKAAGYRLSKHDGAYELSRRSDLSRGIAPWGLTSA